MIYGHKGTIHQTGYVDVELAPEGHVVAVWFRCHPLPFKQTKDGLDRAVDMERMYKNGYFPPIEAIEFTEEKDPKQTQRENIESAIDNLAEVIKQNVRHSCRRISALAKLENVLELANSEISETP